MRAFTQEEADTEAGAHIALMGTLAEADDRRSGARDNSSVPTVGTTGLQCRRWDDGVDAAMGKQSNAGPYPDEVFRATPEVRGGIACFTGTRVGVSQLLGYLRDSHTIEDFVNDFPTVTRDQAQRAIERIDNEYIREMERGCADEQREEQDRGAGDGGITA